MPRRVKEEEKIEMIIRGLLKQPDNRRCINCNSLRNQGPQYVCTTFWTFVCTNCSGVHREFNHRVKSVSMAKFNGEEIMALQAGGNERAKQIYFKTWDPQHLSYPDSSNLQRLREFINHVYIDRRYSGENNKLSMIKSDSRSNSCEWPSDGSSRGRRDEFSEGPSFERASNSGRDDFYGRSSFEKSNPSNKNRTLNLKDFLEERSPRYSQETPRSSSVSSRPARFEIVDDRFREDGSVKLYERHSKKEPRAASCSPRSQRSKSTSLPAVRPFQVILGEKVPELRIEGPPRANDGKDAEGSARSQKAADASSSGLIGGNEKQYTAKPSSLIDFFDDKPEPASSPAEPQAQPVASDEGSSVASSSTQSVATVPNLNSVESLLFDLSAPVTSPSAGMSQVSAGGTAAQLNSPKAIDVGTDKAPEISDSIGALAITVVNKDQLLHSDSKNPTVKEIQMHQLTSNQQWNGLPASNDLSIVPVVPPKQSSKAVNPREGSTSARKEIPMELFSSNFTSFTPAVAGWQMHLPHGGYGMQFHTPAMSATAYPNPPKPRNPFDIGDDRLQVQAPIFASMSPLQRALPNMPTSAALESRTPPYATAMSSPSHVSPYAMSVPLVPGAYMGQLSNNKPLTRPPGNADFGRTEDAFASLNPIQQASRTESLPAGPTSPLPRAGNPFG